VGLIDTKPATTRWYRQKLTLLVDALGFGRPLIDVMDVDLVDWYAGLPVSVFTRHGYGRAVRRFFRWLAKWGIADNLAQYLELPQLPRTARYGIQDHDARAMLEIVDRSTWIGVRDYAIMCFVESTGCRLQGVCGVETSNLNLQANDELRYRVVVREKFTKDRTVFLTPDAVQALSCWLLVRPGGGNDAVFVSEDGHALGTRAVYERFKIHAARAGVKNCWSPHQWRHRFGRMMAQSGMPLGLLAEIMGHESVDVTVRHYGRFAVPHLHEAHSRYFRAS
jgi:site-specific recombinase XerC